MAKIYYGQYSGLSLWSKLIKWFTWGNRSHTSVFLPPVKGTFRYVVEAWKGGVRKTMWRDGHKRGTIIDVYSVECTDEQMRTFYISLEKEIGKKYDYWGVLGFTTRSYVQDPEKWFCSELVFTIFLRAGIRLLNNIQPHMVSPKLMGLPTLAKFETRLIV